MKTHFSRRMNFRVQSWKGKGGNPQMFSSKCKVGRVTGINDSLAHSVALVSSSLAKQEVASKKKTFLPRPPCQKILQRRSKRTMPMNVCVVSCIYFSSFYSPGGHMQLNSIIKVKFQRCYIGSELVLQFIHSLTRIVISIASMSEAPFSPF